MRSKLLIALLFVLLKFPAVAQDDGRDVVLEMHRHFEVDSMVFPGDTRRMIEYCLAMDEHSWVYSDIEFTYAQDFKTMATQWDGQIPPFGVLFSDLHAQCYRICRICYRKERLREKPEDHSEYETLDRFLTEHQPKENR